jgi:hypothetical protein
MERHEAWINRAKSSLEIAGTRNSNLVYYEVVQKLQLIKQG